MKRSEVGGVAKIAGIDFAFPVQAGYGLVTIEGRLALVSFVCPMESMPPRGSGQVMLTSWFTLAVRDGRFYHDGTLVHAGVEMKDVAE